MAKMVNVLTVDVEDYFQVHAFESVVRRSDWPRFESRVSGNTERVLGLLRDLSVKATFFILGWVAERYPGVVRAIDSDGHELATHGYGHELVYRQSPQDFVVDLRRSMELIESATGKLITGYRAPSFSITRDSLWALDLLREMGMRYDSSIFPLCYHDRYGIPDAERHAHRLPNGLLELPIATVAWMGRNWPVGGGGYLRLLPYEVTRWALGRINAEGHPFVVYFHPWELDTQQPRIAAAPPLSRFRHYVNQGTLENKLRRLCEDFAFAPVSKVYARELRQAEEVAQPVCG